ncbi:MAG: ferritin-like domain-containing protein [Symploca sp. SIO2B6]|nr:ferritin-like domain-containing protein [Symploca sp. SIO2B6]
MTVHYPRKFLNSLRVQDILSHVIQQRELHMMILNRYRFNEQHSCLELSHLIERLNGQPRELIRDLSHHVADEARHAVWLTDLLYDLGQDIGMPLGVSYVGKFERLLDKTADDFAEHSEDKMIAAIAAINVTEKRGCALFSAHIKALKQAPKTEENFKIKETIERILPEEAGHVSWGTRWLARIAKKSDRHRAAVEQAKRKYAAIEQAAFEAGLDVMIGAELRQLDHLLNIIETLPLWERPKYLLERLPETLIAPELQLARLKMAQAAWQLHPQEMLQRFVPMFLGGEKGLDQLVNSTPAHANHSG